MDYSRRPRPQQPYSSPSRATYASPANSQPDAKLDFSNRMARAKAAMLAREHKYHPYMFVPEIAVSPSLDTVLESDEEKP
ncbi:uncharacterized protein L3040_006660 [Drepanopeziza brunnea f. sp. 'multigermtubi']|uniref:Uncharacterized protein n=1 Tax=Marssonina brunnea f. sp. multigermtubi (strain MB_m1) TaxID=1072389 RepID=K1WY78_MARBU|nr:uncharacterized protein MBM_04403 [Drepanopeziza brunnea f. sp. 'multigermtubi' MB_m1]EKD17542.1 hypothetical protein MBM_04403 [Drepanopeziza brunnea f. sp. 'multigermtubi' MB_m1]KAJ5038987.1 hypothetical protein L3040_006660 [Drepanopeziza brunnea f. sp. 'multigermtubi']